MNSSTYSTQFLGREVKVHIDRPLGSKHSKHDFYYPVNYGYTTEEIAPDGEYLDVYVLGVFQPIETFSGTYIAVIQRVNDEDDKLVVVPRNKDYSTPQILALTEFQERFFESRVILSHTKKIR